MKLRIGGKTTHCHDHSYRDIDNHWKVRQSGVLSVKHSRPLWPTTNGTWWRQLASLGRAQVQCRLSLKWRRRCGSTSLAGYKNRRLQKPLSGTTKKRTRKHNLQCLHWIEILTFLQPATSVSQLPWGLSNFLQGRAQLRRVSGINSLCHCVFWHASFRALIGSEEQPSEGVGYAHRGDNRTGD